MVKPFKSLIVDEVRFHEMSKLAAEWSRQFTLDKFEKDIKSIIDDSIDESFTIN